MQYGFNFSKSCNNAMLKRHYKRTRTSIYYLVQLCENLLKLEKVIITPIPGPIDRNTCMHASAQI